MPRPFRSSYSIDYHIGIDRTHLPTFFKRRIWRQDWRPSAHRVTRRRCDWVRPTAFQLQLSEETTRSLGALRNSFTSAKVRYDTSPAIAELSYGSIRTQMCNTAHTYDSYACEEHFALAREALVARQNPASHNLTCRGSIGREVGRYLGGYVGW